MAAAPGPVDVEGAEGVAERAFLSPVAFPITVVFLLSLFVFVSSASEARSKRAASKKEKEGLLELVDSEEDFSEVFLEEEEDESQPTLKPSKPPKYAP